MTLIMTAVCKDIVTLRWTVTAVWRRGGVCDGWGRASRGPRRRVGGPRWPSGTAA